MSSINPVFITPINFRELRTKIEKTFDDHTSLIYLYGITVIDMISRRYEKISMNLISYAAGRKTAEGKISLLIDDIFYKFIGKTAFPSTCTEEEKEILANLFEVVRVPLSDLRRKLIANKAPKKIIW